MEFLRQKKVVNFLFQIAKKEKNAKNEIISVIYYIIREKTVAEAFCRRLFL